MAEVGEYVAWEASAGSMMLEDGRRVEVEPGDELFMEECERDGGLVAVFTDHRKRQVH